MKIFTAFVFTALTLSGQDVETKNQVTPSEVMKMYLQTTEANGAKAYDSLAAAIGELEKSVAAHKTTEQMLQTAFDQWRQVLMEELAYSRMLTVTMSVSKQFMDQLPLEELVKMRGIIEAATKVYHKYGDLRDKAREVMLKAMTELEDRSQPIPPALRKGVEGFNRTPIYGRPTPGNRGSFLTKKGVLCQR